MEFLERVASLVGVIACLAIAASTLHLAWVLICDVFR